jgi:NTP pyrophosphatase (non-canonical NTP hydrolase)
MEKNRIWGAIAVERERQQNLWNREHAWGYGDCSSDRVDDTVKVAVLLEEAGEVARAVLTQNHENLRAELVQVAAVALAWLEGL